jgi:uncharacterized sulfatase
LKADPYEIKNLASEPAQQARLARMRDVQEKWEARIKDVGLLSEWEMHARAKGSSPYEVGHDPKKYNFDAIFAAANTASSMRAADLSAIVKFMDSGDPAVRYWGATGLLCHGKDGVAAGHEQLVKALEDDSPIVRVVAAEALGRFGSSDDTAAALKVLLKSCQPSEDTYLTTAAWNALDYLDQRAEPAKEAIQAISADPLSPPQRYGGYSKTLKNQTLRDLK